MTKFLFPVLISVCLIAVINGQDDLLYEGGLGLGSGSGGCIPMDEQRCLQLHYQNQQSGGGGCNFGYQVTPYDYVCAVCVCYPCPGGLCDYDQNLCYGPTQGQCPGQCVYC